MYQRQSRVRYSEVDQKGNLTIVSLINYLQDCCSFQAEDLGVGLDYLRDRHLGWYITYWEIKIHSLPKMGEHIRISTWPVFFKGMFGSRNFKLESSEEETMDKEYVRADSFWVLMDLENSRPARLTEDITGRYETNPPLDGEWQGRKIKPFDDFNQIKTMEVMPVHLDTNYHMNNAYYIEIARDVLPQERKIYGIRCEYKKPALLGDKIVISSSENEAAVQVKLASENDEVFSMIEFETQGPL